MSIIIGGEIGVVMYHIGGSNKDIKPNSSLINNHYHIIGSGTKFVKMVLQKLSSAQVDQNTIVKIVERTFLFASLSDKSASGFTKLCYVNGGSHDLLFT